MGISIEKQFVDKFSQAILKQQKVKWIQLKNYANTLLYKMIQISQQNEQQQHFLNYIDNDNIVTAAINLQKNTSSDLSKLRDIEINVLFFRSILNTFLQRQSMLGVIDQFGEHITLLSEFEQLQLYKNFLTKGRDFRGKISKFNDYLSSIKSRKKQVQRLENVANKRLETFKAALNQAERRAGKTEEEVRYKNSKKKWYYRLRDYYHITEMSSKAVSIADISEIYANTILNRKISQLKSKNIEEILKQMSDVVSSDQYRGHNNVYEITAGDFTFKPSKKRQVQILLKMGNDFMLGSYMQYIRFAYNLQYIEKELTKEQVSKILENKNLSNQFLTKEKVDEIGIKLFNKTFSLNN